VGELSISIHCELTQRLGEFLVNIFGSGRDEEWYAISEDILSNTFGDLNRQSNEKRTERDKWRDGYHVFHVCMNGGVLWVGPDNEKE
jgi:hypothetical protein